MENDGRNLKRQTVFLQLFVTLILLVAASVASTGYFGIKSLRTYAIEDAGSRQWELVLTLASLYGRESDKDSRNLSSRKEESESFISYLPETLGYRITIIAADGRVLADTHKDARTMDNHGNRPEVREAVSNGRGSSIRMSDTLGGVPLIYTAYYDPSLSLVFRVARTVEGLQAGLDRSITPPLGRTNHDRRSPTAGPTGSANRPRRPLRRPTRCSRSAWACTIRVIATRRRRPS